MIKGKRNLDMRLTDMGERAIADMPNLTWDEVVRRANGTPSQTSAPQLGTRPPEGR